MTKVFGIGFHKTGVTTLGTALGTLGYRVCQGARPIREALGHRRMMDLLNRADLDPILNVAEQYDGFADNPWFILYRELDRRFPSSKFVLTVRDEQHWLNSVIGYYGQSESDLRRWIYGTGIPDGNEQTFLEHYRKHNREVREYFAERPDDLLIVDWEQGHGWPELSRFLARPSPSTSFPHENRRASSVGNDDYRPT